MSFKFDFFTANNHFLIKHGSHSFNQVQDTLITHNHGRANSLNHDRMHSFNLQATSNANNHGGANYFNFNQDQAASITHNHGGAANSFNHGGSHSTNNHGRVNYYNFNQDQPLKHHLVSPFNLLFHRYAYCVVIYNKLQLIKI